MVVELTDFEFIEKFKPIKNHLDDNASENGCMFETYGAELDYVRSMVISDPERVWTVLDCDGELIISSGYSFVNRFGYLITEVAAESGQEYIVRDEDQIFEDEDEDQVDL